MKYRMDCVIKLMMLSLFIKMSLEDGEFCGHEMRKDIGAIQFPSFNETMRRFYTRRENMETYCFYYKRLDKKSISPLYLRITFKQLSVGDEPLQIQAKRQRYKTRWETLNSFLNIQVLSPIKVSIDAKKYPLVKMKIPRKTTSVKFVEYSVIYPIILRNGTELPHPSLRYCGFSGDLVHVIDCFTPSEDAMTCTFKCKKGRFPLNIEPDTYPSFQGFCSKGEASPNWPRHENRLCVSEEEVERNCFHYNYCEFHKDAIMKWYGEDTPNSAFKGSALIRRTTQECSETEASMMEEIQYDLLQEEDCSEECKLGKINGKWKYFPSCSVRPMPKKCMRCRYPKKSSRCLHLTGFGL